MSAVTAVVPIIIPVNNNSGNTTLVVNGNKAVECYYQVGNKCFTETQKTQAAALVQQNQTTVDQVFGWIFGIMGIVGVILVLGIIGDELHLKIYKWRNNERYWGRRK